MYFTNNIWILSFGFIRTMEKLKAFEYVDFSDNIIHSFVLYYLVSSLSILDTKIVFLSSVDSNL